MSDKTAKSELQREEQTNASTTVSDFVPLLEIDHRRAHARRFCLLRDADARKYHSEACDGVRTGLISQMHPESPPKGLVVATQSTHKSGDETNLS